MNGIPTSNMPFTNLPPFAQQSSYQESDAAASSPQRHNAGLYSSIESAYEKQLLWDLYNIRRAHPELTPQQCRYILETKIRGAFSKRQSAGFRSSQTPGGLLSVLPQDGGMEMSAVPLSRTESCPLPGPYPALGKSQVMRRQHSSITPSTMHAAPFAEPVNTAYLLRQYSDAHFQSRPDAATAFPGAASNNNTLCFIPEVSPSFPPAPADLPVQHISAPAHLAPHNPPFFSSSITGYLQQDFRDDPYSAVRGRLTSQFPGATSNEDSTISELSYSQSFDILSQNDISAQYTQPQLVFPYTIDINNAAFLAPRMEAQLSTSTFFDSTSTNAELESVDDLLQSDLPIDMVDMAINNELQYDLAGIGMSASQLTVRQDQGIPQPLTSTLDSTMLNHLPSVANYEQISSTDLYLIPDLTNTVGTPSSPAQMSRQHSAATSYSCGYGAIPHTSGSIDLLTAPEMGREWSDQSNMAIDMSRDLSRRGCAVTSDGQPTRKRVRQLPPEDINLLLKGAGIDTDIVGDYGQCNTSSMANSAIKDFGEWHTQMSVAAAKAQALEDEVRESQIGDNNPAKLRRVSVGQNIGDARAHAQSLETANLHDLNTSTNFRGFVATTRPLPDFDQHLAMRRSETGALVSNTSQPTANNKQVVTATTTTVTTSTVFETVHNQTTGATRQGSTNGCISINTQMSRPYVRRTHPRVYCDQCNEVPDGFRGDHELRRHKERVHAKNKKVWVTKDISPDGDFLSDCKACRRGKYYFADYNAAAHLRRQHFCKEGKRGKSKKERDGERKSNIEKVRSRLEAWGIEWKDAGPENGRVAVTRTGEEFTLKFLRRWMQQIDIPQSHSGSKGNLSGALSDEEEEDELEETEEVKKEDMGTHHSLIGSPGVGLLTGARDIEHLASRREILDPPKKSILASSIADFGVPRVDLQPPSSYNFIDVIPSSDSSHALLQTQRELQALLAPTMDRIDLGVESLIRLQNSLG